MTPLIDVFFNRRRWELVFNLVKIPSLGCPNKSVKITERMINADFKEIIITLYEKDYHLGVGTLINSLAKSKFEGLIYIGYRDNLPPWISQLKYLDKEYYTLESLTIKFTKVITDIHFGYYKCFFLQDTLNIYSTASKIFYFDPDIVINAPWSFFSNWVDNGICLCLDNCFPFVHNNHPWRSDWRKLAIGADLENSTKIKDNTDVNYYVNSGFIGISRKDAILVTRWIDLTDKYKKLGGNLKIFEKNAHRSYKGDQDLLNAAITISPDVNFSTIGKEGMGFAQPAYLMSHAVSNIKPWKKNFISYVIKNGIKPDSSEKAFFNFCTCPIQIFSKATLTLKKNNLKIASVIGRIIGY